MNTRYKTERRTMREQTATIVKDSANREL